MISFAETLPIGNAVKIVLMPSTAAKRWKIVRKSTDDISGVDDPAAKLVFEGNDVLVVDSDQLTNGATYFYAEFDFDGASWKQDGDSVGVTPGTSYNMSGPDVLTLVINRLRVGLKAAITANAIAPTSGTVKVYSAPPNEEDVKWPVVSVHVDLDAGEGRGIGELVVGDMFDQTVSPDGAWRESEGWLSRIRLKVIGWSLNPDERITLRQVIKSVILGNLPVFDAAGMIQVDFSQVDAEDFERYAAPIYQTIGDFSCLAPVVLEDTQDFVSDVTVDGKCT